MRAIERAPRGLDDAPDRPTAIQTGLSRTVVNPQAFLVKIGPARPGAAEIEKAVALPCPAKMERHGAAAFNGLGERFADGPPKPSDLIPVQLVRRQPRRDVRAEQHFTGIDVSKARHQGLVQ